MLKKIILIGGLLSCLTSSFANNLEHCPGSSNFVFKNVPLSDDTFTLSDFSKKTWIINTPFSSAKKICNISNGLSTALSLIVNITSQGSVSCTYLVPGENNMAVLEPMSGLIADVSTLTPAFSLHMGNVGSIDKPDITPTHTCYTTTGYPEKCSWDWKL